MKYSDCCNANYDEDLKRCNNCKEPCGYYEDEEDELRRSNK